MSGFRRAPLSSLLDLAWRTAFRVGFPLARIWWRLAHARHEGVAVAVYVGPALLLVRCSCPRKRLAAWRRCVSQRIDDRARGGRIFATAAGARGAVLGTSPPSVGREQLATRSTSSAASTL